MAIVQIVNFSMFCDAFTRMGRQDQFSYAAKRALFDYLDNTSDEAGEDIELDVIALCCEYEESTAEEINVSYSLGFERQEDESEEDFDDRLNEEVGEFLENNLTLIMSKDGNFVFATF